MSKIIVCQYGARHRYAIPRLFYQKNCLGQLLTGAHADSHLGKVVNFASKIIPLPSEILRLKERKINGIPLNLVFSADTLSWREKQLDSLLTMGNVSEWLKARDRLYFSLIYKYIQWDGVSHLYTMMGQNLELLREAEKRGVQVVVDVFVSPIYLRQTFKEKIRFSMELDILEKKHFDVEAHYAQVFKYSNVILCPSKWVADGVVALDPQFEDKIQICPYGSSLNFDHNNRKPIEGRIFWAGGDWFRKGLHHLAAAADILKPKYPHLDFRVAGITDASIQKMSIFKNLNFLGKLNRLQMKEEFSTASMFVFPTLTEGMASVVIEAIASGCPVITTRGAGVDALENGKAGIILESVDTECISSAIEELILDKNLFDDKVENCLQLSLYYGEQAWQSRLMTLIN